MGYGSQTISMISFIIFVLISFQFKHTHNLVVDESLNAAEYFNVHDPKVMHYTEGSEYGKENQIKKVSGEDEKEEKEALLLEKFRALLGLKNFKSRRLSNMDLDYRSPTPAPSPAIEAEVPAPAPPQPLRFHSHHPLRPSQPSLIPHKIIKKDRDKGEVLTRTLIAVLVSGGVTLILCLIGLFWFFKKSRKQRKQLMNAVLMQSSGEGTRGRSKYTISQQRAKKVSSDPGPDLFYLDSLGSALAPQPFSVKQHSETQNASANQNTSYRLPPERSEPLVQPSNSESHNSSCTAVEKLRSDHEIADLVINEPDGCNSLSGNEVVQEETHSSDDESFHSFSDSHSSKVRFSNASTASVSDILEITSACVSNVSPCFVPSQNTESIQSSDFQSYPPQVSPTSDQNTPTTSHSPDNRKISRSLPPPPPPPPPRVNVSPSHCSRSTLVTSNLTIPSLPNVSSSMTSDYSPGSNKTPRSDSSSSPPMQPKYPVGIPPPPCPPPFLGVNGTSLKWPPPPPAPMGKDGAPLPKLKPLHWDKVRAAPDRSTVWDKLKSSSFELDEETIESLFGYNLQISMKSEETKSKSPSPSKHILEPKRLQNITILSKALNVTTDQVCDALLRGDGLSLPQLEALSKMVPTEEEEAKLTSYDGDTNDLGSAEKLVKAMLNVPFAFPRIESMLYKETFEDEVLHLRKSFSILEEACKELRSSRLFLKLLETVLKTGNRMNVGTIRGGAKAFKLDALLKLADVKGIDGKTTLLHFVVQEIVRSEGVRVSDGIMGKINQRNKNTNAEETEENYKRMGLDHVAGLSTELCNAKKTATIDLDVLASSVSNLSNGINKLKLLLQEVLSTEEEKNGNFVRSMRSFFNYAENSLKELKEDEDRVLLRVREITEYFHGDVSKDESNPLRIFVIVRDFLGMLDRVCKELRSMKIPSSPSPLAPFR